MHTHYIKYNWICLQLDIYALCITVEVFSTVRPPQGSHTI